MEEKSGMQKPLRPFSNFRKDFSNTYMKNKGNSQQVHIHEVEDINESKAQKDELENSSNTNEIEVEIKTNEEQANLSNEDNLEDKNFIAEYENKIQSIEKERNDFKDQAIRLAAEMENSRRRHQKEKSELIDFANERLLFQMLVFIDDLENAITAAKQNNEQSALFTGIELIYQKTLKLFETAGVKQMESAVGKPFDVEFHEALMQMASAEPEGTIVQVFQPGYMIQSKVLRHAKVVTSSGNENSNS